MKLKYLGVLTLAAILCCGSLMGCSANKNGNQQIPEPKETATLENKVTMDGQTLGLTGVENARQIGGYYTTDGRKVKSDFLLRSAKLGKATQEDIKKLTEKYNLGTVIDFRTTNEVAEDPDPEIEGVDNQQIRILEESNSSDSSAAMTKIYGADPVNGIIELVKNNMVSDDMYITTVKSETAQQGFSEFFRVLLDNQDEKAVLWHCTGGKDRAGTATVLVLSALGVDEKTILDDFALTNDFYEKKIEYMGKEAAKQTNDPDIIEGVKTLTGVSKDFMEKMIKTLNKEYGSVQNYIIKELGISKEEIVKLQDMYLE